MDKPNAKQQEIIDRNIKVLEDLEKKFGVAWVKKTYENAPTIGSKFFDLATKRHAIYHYRKNGQIGDVDELVRILEKKIVVNALTTTRTITPVHKNNKISPQLEGSLAALNGKIGKTIDSVEEFYVRWLKSKEPKIHKQKIKKLVDEAVAKKAEVLVKIAGFYRNRNEKDEAGVIPKLKKNKKEKKNKIRIPEPKSEKMQEPSENQDVYYISAKALAPLTTNIHILKNGQTFKEQQLNKITNNEAEYSALIEVLSDIKDKKAVIYSNSQLVVYTLTGFYKLKASNLKPYFDKARGLMDGKDVNVLWIASHNANIPAFQMRPFAPAKNPRLNEKRVDLSQITLSAEQKELFELLEATNQPIFLTGKAGTGKSLLLQYFRQKSAKKIVVCASTGVAALNVGGQTIHSLFKIAPGFTKEGTLKPDKKVESLLKHVDTVVIDEVSMVSPDLMDAIDQRLRQAKKTAAPFGGIQIVMFGDLYQLPPVMSDKELQRYFEETYGGYFFFNAHVWQSIKFEIRELTNIFRQKNDDFREILNAVREGTITEEQLAVLNKRAGLTMPAEGVIILATTNYAVAKINKERLSQLKEKEFEYKATITGNLEPSAFPTEETLCLKKGAQVMLLKNDREKRWVNGTIGYIQSLDKNEIKVTIDGITHSIPKETWQKVRYYYDQTENKIEEEVVSSFEQFPLRLAWAITIHKSQGQTYTAVAIDMGRGAFAHGQAYVALSRCTTLEGLFLKREILRDDIIVESKITDFMKLKKTKK